MKSMKIFILIIMLCLELLISSGAAQAHTITEGTVSLGGCTNALSESRDFTHSDNYTILGVNISGGYFVKDNIEIGISLSYSSRNGTDMTTRSSGLTPFIIYHLSIDDISNFYFGAGMIYTKYDYHTSRYGTDQDSAGYKVMAGWEYFLNPHVALDIGFSYSRIEWDIKGYSIYEDKETRIVGPSLGLKMYF